MRSPLGTLVRSAGTAGIVLAAVCTLPALAHADEPDPFVPGSCAATVQGAHGSPLTLDAGAPLGVPGLLSLGLGAEAAGGPLLTVPLKETVDALGVSRLPVLPEVAGGGCAAVQGLANGTGYAVQGLLPGDGDTDDDGSDDGGSGPDNGDDSDDSDNAPPVAAPPATPPTDEPDEQAPGERNPAPTDDPVTLRPIELGQGFHDEFFGGGLADAGTFELTGLDTLGTLPFPDGAGLTPPASPVRAPGVDLPEGGPVPDADEASAEPTDSADGVVAMPVAHAPERVPLIIALFALMLAISALVRAWYIRKAL